MSSSTVCKMKLSALGITGMVTASYFGFYTAYDKQTKTLKPALLADLVLCKRGLDWTLVELNKAVSLSACTTMLMSFLPSFGEWSAELLFQSMSLLWAHSVYSSYKFYGGSVQRLLRDKPVKQLSIALGVAGQLALSAGFWGYVSDDALVLGASVLGLAHFYSMEIDYKGVLQVRPYAYLPFAAGIPVLSYWALGRIRR